MASTLARKPGQIYDSRIGGFRDRTESERARVTRKAIMVEVRGQAEVIHPKDDAETRPSKVWSLSQPSLIEPDYGISGLGAYTSYRRYPGKFFPTSRAVNFRDADWKEIKADQGR